ncbi:hypothetical protein [Nostoc sp.]|uniref:hypothetical protein n=1 Tax=Nostoc sp. TaxID=1180 RepID=UPI002FFC0102
MRCLQQTLPTGIHITYTPFVFNDRFTSIIFIFGVDHAIVRKAWSGLTNDFAESTHICWIISHPPRSNQSPQEHQATSERVPQFCRESVLYLLLQYRMALIKRETSSGQGVGGRRNFYLCRPT